MISFIEHNKQAIKYSL